MPISKRIYVAEKTIQSIRTQEDKSVMKEAADLLYSDYKTDKNLTAFTNLDFVDFYETKWSKESSADCFQVRSVSQDRFVKLIGELSDDIMEEIRIGLSKVLSIDTE